MVWQKEMPRAVGKYWTRTYDGDEAGVLTVCFHESIGTYCPEYPARRTVKDRFTKSVGIGEIVEGTTWGGWWWSEPLPTIPPFDATPENSEHDILYAVVLIGRDHQHTTAVCRDFERAKKIVESNEGDL